VPCATVVEFGDIARGPDVVVAGLSIVDADVAPVAPVVTGFVVATESGVVTGPGVPDGVEGFAGDETLVTLTSAQFQNYVEISEASRRNNGQRNVRNKLPYLKNPTMYNVILVVCPTNLLRRNCSAASIKGRHDTISPYRRFLVVHQEVFRVVASIRTLLKRKTKQAASRPRIRASVSSAPEYEPFDLVSLQKGALKGTYHPPDLQDANFNLDIRQLVRHLSTRSSKFSVNTVVAREDPPARKFRIDRPAFRIIASLAGRMRHTFKMMARVSKALIGDILARHTRHVAQVKLNETLVVGGNSPLKIGH
jgi:hypothetical protein